MLRLRQTLLLLTALLSGIAAAEAALYGFSEANPYTYEEEILDIRVPPEKIINYRQKMRDNVIMLSNFAKSKNRDFQILVHEGEELLDKYLWEYHLEGYNAARRAGVNASDPTFLAKLRAFTPDHRPAVGSPGSYYIQSIDGIVLNNLLCRDRALSPAAKNSGLKIISIDKCDNPLKYDAALDASAGREILLYGFFNPDFAFNNAKTQPLVNENARNIFKLADAGNILFLIEENNYADKDDFINDIRNSNFDVIVIRPLFHNKIPFTPEEINSLKYKKNGTRRLIIAMMNVSEADDTEYYWKKEWKLGVPSWLKRASFVNPHAAITEYWHEDWKKIIAKYFQGIVDSGFDGAFLTGTQNYRYFEKQTPLD